MRMTGVLDAIAAEFQDLSAAQTAQLAVRMVMAGVLGSILGWDREQARKSAGLRTHILLAVGSAAFIAVPLQAGMQLDDVSRILQGLLAGIGFLGAGTILKDHKTGEVHGLTTAAGLWLTACVGAAAGFGREMSAVLITAFGWFALNILLRLERHSPQSPKPKDESNSSRRG
jgi:putative Mg2+ transporter-C (MgtC) family protein